MAVWITPFAGKRAPTAGLDVLVGARLPATNDNAHYLTDRAVRLCCRCAPDREQARSHMKSRRQGNARNL